MTTFQIINFAVMLQTAPPAPSSTTIDLAIWKMVIFIGVAAIIIFYGIKRIADIVVTRKTNAMIRKIGEDETEENK